MNRASSSASIGELVLADAPERWSALGFSLDGNRLRLGSVVVRFGGEDAGRGLVAWSLRGIASTELDGLVTTRCRPPAEDGAQDGAPAQDRPDASQHPNGVIAIDHVVAMTPDLDRTVRALQAAGLDLRRIREEPTPAGAPRQAFFRLGGPILEVVQEPDQAIAKHGQPDRPARLWGLALLAEDLDRTVAALSPHCGAVRDAVQPGRRIATIKRDAGLAVPVALMSPPPSSPASG